MEFNKTCLYMQPSHDMSDSNEGQKNFEMSIENYVFLKKKTKTKNVSKILLVDLIVNLSRDSIYVDFTD